MPKPLVIALFAVATLSYPLPAKALDACPTETAVNPFEQRILPDLLATQGGGGKGGTAGPTGDRPLRHVWVLDHSGSMYPDYSPGKPRRVPYYVENAAFRQFVSTGIGANFRDGRDSAALVLFNEYAYGWNGALASRFNGGQGPWFDTLKVASRAELEALLAKVPPPPYGAPVAGLPAPVPGAHDCGVPNAASNCSKMLEGLQGARSLLDEGSGEGIIWLVTDNIYEGGATGKGLSTAEVDQNRAFYESIKNTPEYRVVVAYPVVHGAEGEWLGSTSLFVYGIYYIRDLGRHSSGEEVRRLLGDGAPGTLASAAQTGIMKGFSASGSPSPGRPFRLKPLDQDLVRISLAADVEQVKKHLEIGDKVKLKAKMRVQNLLDHRVIDEVTFRVKNAKWAGFEPNQRATKGVRMDVINTVCPDKFLSSPVTVHSIEPGKSVEVEVPLEMPPVDYKIRSASDLLQMAGNDHVVMGGVLQAELTNVKSRMFIPPEAIRGTYGADSLPAVFENPQVGAYTAQFVGKTRKLENPGREMAILSILGGLAALVLGVLGSFMLTRVSRRLVIDGADKGAISIPRLGGARIERGSEFLGKATLSMGGSIGFKAMSGYSSRRDGDGWVLQKGQGPAVRVEFRGTKRR